jgi:hypothetical protein
MIQRVKTCVLFVSLFVYLYSICILVCYALLAKDLKRKSTEQKTDGVGREKSTTIVFQRSVVQENT